MKYSEIAERYKIKKDEVLRVSNKIKDDPKMMAKKESEHSKYLMEKAAFTHFIQNLDDVDTFKYYEKDARNYFKKLVEKDKNIKEGEFFNLSNIEWDIPFPPNKNPEFKFIDLFAGIGGIRQAFQFLGGKCVFTSEWDRFAKLTYEENFGEIPFGDITKIDEKNIPDHDILLGGFPCQPFSIAGVSKKNSLGREHGFLDKTQGTLFFDIARILKEKRPKTFLLENVKNLKSHDEKKTFKVIKETLEKLDYTVYEKILNSKYLVPQRRERIFIVGFDNKFYNKNEKFNFPELEKKDLKLRSILSKDSVDEKYTLKDGTWNSLQNHAKKHKEKGNGFGFGLANLDGIARTLSARYGKDGGEILIPQDGKNPRKLTPEECQRLQGFHKDFKIPVSDTQAYKQFGNSVAVPVVESVAKEILKTMKEFEN